VQGTAHRTAPRKGWAIALAAALAWLASGAGADPQAALVDGTASGRVLVLRSSKLAPFEAALDGIVRELRGDLALEVRDIDPRSRPSTPIRSDAFDVLVPLGSEATQWALDSSEGVPIVFAMVLNPVSTGLVHSMSRPGGRLTGASLDIPPDVQFRALHEVVGAERVAVLYNPKLTGPLVREAQRSARRAGIELVPIPVGSPTDLEYALERVDESFDALWSVADPTVFSRGTVERILLHTLEHRVAFMGLSEQYVRAGALLALSTSYEENGRLAAQHVRAVLAGAAPAELAIATPNDVEVVFNPRTAKRLELALPDAPLLRLRAVK
jgi:putative ABC transport system substrate-binding protein